MSNRRRSEGFCSLNYHVATFFLVAGLMMVSNGGSFSMTDAVQKEDAAKVGPGSQEQDAETTSAEQGTAYNRDGLSPAVFSI